MFSLRFDREIIITSHAQARMQERELSAEQVLDVIESGMVRQKDGRRMWIFKTMESRRDNLICAAVVMDDRLVVKTVMVNWELME